MRTTHSMMVSSAIRYMNEGLSRLGEAQQRVATGKRFDKVSDSPSTVVSGLSLESAIRRGEAYLDTAHLTQEWQSVTELSLTGLTDVSMRGLNLAKRGISDTMGQDERAAIAAEIDVLIDEAVNFGNTTLQGRYIYSGFKTGTKPFERIAGAPDTVNYSGDNGQIQRSIGSGQNVTVNVDGDNVFSPVVSDLIEIQEALLANDGVAIKTGIDKLNNSMGGVRLARATNGTRQRQVEDRIDYIEKNQLEIKGLLSQKMDESMPEAIAKLRQQETIYQASLQAGQRTLSMMNLFDYLR